MPLATDCRSIWKGTIRKRYGADRIYKLRTKVAKIIKMNQLQFNFMFLENEFQSELFIRKRLLQDQIQETDRIQSKII